MSEPLSHEIEDLIRQINTGGGEGLGCEASLARLQALHASALSRDLQNLTNAIDSAKTGLGTRICEMNQQILDSSESANAHSRALVWWTRGIVLATVAYVVLTAGLLKVSNDQMQVAKSALQAQAEPELIMEIVKTTEEGTRLILKNEGTYPVTDLFVDADIIVLVGPPINQKVSRTHRLAETAGSPWWKIDELKGGDTQTKSLEEIGIEALGHQRFNKSAKEKGDLSGVSPGASVQIMSTIKFRMVAHRAVDRKRYRQEVFTIVLEDAKNGKPHFVDPRLLSYPYLKEAGIDR